MKTIKDIDLNEKKVLIRCDFNVPIKDGKIVDDTRIEGALPTIKYAIEHNAKVILLSHLGRVKEQEDLEKNDLSPVAECLSKKLEKDVLFSENTRGEELEATIDSMLPGDVLLIQNTRYEDLDGKKESKNDPELGRYWASLGDVFVNDAFGTIHRAHASNVGIASNMESCIGFLIEKELKALSILEEPTHPFVVILGGAKVSDKIGVIENLVTKADKILIGGGMAFTFLKAKGYEIGKSLLDEENIDFCKKMLEKYPEKIELPVDFAVTNEFTNDEDYRVKMADEITKDEMGLDIGEKTVEKYYRKMYARIKTINRWTVKTGNNIGRKKLYKQYSYLGKRTKDIKKGNFLTYVDRSKKEYGDLGRMEEQVKNSWKYMSKRLVKIKK